MIKLNLYPITILSKIARQKFEDYVKSDPLKKEGNFALVQLSSVAATFWCPHFGTYGATKRYDLIFSRLFAKQIT